MVKSVLSLRKTDNTLLRILEKNVASMFRRLQFTFPEGAFLYLAQIKSYICITCYPSLLVMSVSFDLYKL